MAADGTIDRDAWAQVITALRMERTKGKTAPFARLVGVDARTVDRWLRRQVAVTEQSVRAVARALDISARDLLVQVGFYRHGELAPPTVPDPREDPVVQAILADPRLTEAERVELVEEQLTLIEEDMRRRQAEYERIVRWRQPRNAS